MGIFTVEEKKQNTSDVKIVVVGVGGGGCNMISNLANSHDLDNVKYIAINTDKQALDTITNEKINKVQIGERLTKGLG